MVLLALSSYAFPCRSSLHQTCLCKVTCSISHLENATWYLMTLIGISILLPFLFFPFIYFWALSMYPKTCFPFNFSWNYPGVLMLINLVSPIFFLFFCLYICGAVGGWKERERENRQERGAQRARERTLSRLYTQHGTPTRCSISQPTIVKS